MRARIMGSSEEANLTIALWLWHMPGALISLEMATSSLRGLLRDQAEWRVVVLYAMLGRQSLSGQHHS